MEDLLGNLPLLVFLAIAAFAQWVAQTREAHKRAREEAERAAAEAAQATDEMPVPTTSPLTSPVSAAPRRTRSSPTTPMPV